MLSVQENSLNLSKKEETSKARDSPSLGLDATLEEPRALAQSLIETLNDPTDVNMLAALYDYNISLNQKRETILKDAHSMLTNFSEEAQNAAKEAYQPQRDAELLKYAQTMEQLEAEESELRALISQSSDSSQKLLLELKELQKDLYKLEKEEQMEAITPLDAQAIQVSMFQSLGINLIEDAEAASKGGLLYPKAQIRCASKNDIHTIEFDPKFSKFFYANYIWEMCS